MAYLVGRFTRLGLSKVQSLNSCYCTIVQAQLSNEGTTRGMPLLEDQCYGQTMMKYSGSESGVIRKLQIGENVSRKDKLDFLISTLLDLKNNKEAVYGALDAWVAWEQNFPIASLKRALLALEREHQWHRVIQVIKWMLSKGQGVTMGTYGQLIRALDMDHRAEEAYIIWKNKVGSDLHSVPWQLCNLMISVYYRNNRLESLVKLFKDLEAFNRKPTEKSIVQKVADAYEMLGLLEEKKRILEKYNDLFSDSKEGKLKQSRKSLKNKSSFGVRMLASSSYSHTEVEDSIQTSEE